MGVGRGDGERRVQLYQGADFEKIFRSFQSPFRLTPQLSFTIAVVWTFSKFFIVFYGSFYLLTLILRPYGDYIGDIGAGVDENGGPNDRFAVVWNFGEFFFFLSVVFVY